MESYRHKSQENQQETMSITKDKKGNKMKEGTNEHSVLVMFIMYYKTVKITIRIQKEL